MQVVDSQNGKRKEKSQTCCMPATNSLVFSSCSSNYRLVFLLWLNITSRLKPPEVVTHKEAFCPHTSSNRLCSYPSLIVIIVINWQMYEYRSRSSVRKKKEEKRRKKRRRKTESVPIVYPPLSETKEKQYGGGGEVAYILTVLSNPLHLAPGIPALNAFSCTPQTGSFLGPMRVALD